MEFSCSLCGYKSDTKKSVIRHLTRKISCGDGVPSMIENHVENKCEFCLKIFNTKPSVKRHQKNCKVKKDNIELELMKKEEEIKNLKNQLSQKSNITINNNIQNNININLAPWNDPLLPNDVEKYYRESVKKIFLAVPTLIKFIHFNTEHPENHNICIRNGRSKTAKVYNGKEWETIDEDQLIATLIADYEQTLEDYSDTKKLSFTKKYQEIKDRDGEEKVYDDLHNEVKRIIYDRNYMVKIKN